MVGMAALEKRSCKRKNLEVGSEKRRCSLFSLRKETNLKITKGERDDQNAQYIPLAWRDTPSLKWSAGR